MKQIRRKPLDPRELKYLSNKQVAADIKHASGQLDVDTDWKSARRSKKINTIVAVLKEMTGELCSCMWCDVSVGCDIDHFWPKSLYPGYMYSWSNMLLSCPECGRHKGNIFPLDGSGQPLLIDPTVENPWEFLDFDHTTGNIGSRYNLVLEQPFPRGVATVEVLKLDCREALAAHYRRSFYRITKAIQHFLETPYSSAVFWDDLNRSDDYGLLGWCFRGLGENENPMSELKTSHPQVWQYCIDKLTE